MAPPPATSCRSVAKPPAPDLWRAVLLPAVLSGVAAFGLSRLPVFQAFENVAWDGLVRLRAELQPRNASDSIALIGIDEASLREALKLEPTNEDAVLALATVLLSRGAVTDALEILQRVPQTPKVAALVERAKAMFVPDDNYSAQLDALLSLVKNDEQARAQFLAILETMGPGDPRTAVYRRKMTGMLFA